MTDELTSERVRRTLEYLLADKSGEFDYRDSDAARDTVLSLARAWLANAAHAPTDEVTTMTRFPGLRAAIQTVRMQHSVWSESDGSRYYVRKSFNDGVSVDCAHFSTAAEASAYIADAIAHAVVEFATTGEASERAYRAQASYLDPPGVPISLCIRAALGEETTNG